MLRLLHGAALVGPRGRVLELARRLAREEAEARGKVFVDLAKVSGEELDKVLAGVAENPGRYYLFHVIVAHLADPMDFSIPVPFRGLAMDNVAPEAGRRWELQPPKRMLALAVEGVEGTLVVDVAEASSPHFSAIYPTIHTLVTEKRLGWLHLSRGVKVVVAAEREDITSRTLNPLKNRLLLFLVDAA